MAESEVRVYAFKPEPVSTVNLVATTATSSVKFNDFSSNVNNRVRKRAVRVFNSGAVTAFVEFGGSSVAATLTTSMPVAAGQTAIFNAQDASYAAVITPSSTATVYFTPGEGT